jgi:ABC-type glutathione transport system ATPase component
VTEPLLRIAKLSKSFGHKGWFGGHPGARAVDDVSLDVYPGETLGIVGESGSGKSTLLRMVLRLIRPTAGTIQLKGRDIWAMNDARRTLPRDMQAIFQDPASSFNPRQTVGAILGAPLDVHGIGTAGTRRAAVSESLARVGLPPDMTKRYPHQLSGGQKQRVAIARAIILKPAVVLADEPTSALDVSVQAQVLKLFQDTKRDLQLTMIFVSHNLAVIRQVSDRVAVMRGGRLVESGTAADVFERPQTDYTRELIAAVPDPFAIVSKLTAQETHL